MTWSANVRMHSNLDVPADEAYHVTGGHTQTASCATWACLPITEGEWCEACSFLHEGPRCGCGERLYRKGRGERVSPWQHVHTAGLTDHDPSPADG